MYKEVIQSIQMIATGHEVEDEIVAQKLEKDGCIYLLGKITSHTVESLYLLAANTLRVQERYAECVSIFNKLNQQIPYAVIKGAVLSSQIYQDPAYRISSDIDLLISPDNLEDIKELLREEGFIQGKVVDSEIVPYSRDELVYQRMFTHQLASFVKSTGNRKCPIISLDVNFGILWGESRIKIDMKEFLTHTEDYKIYDCKIHKLVPIYEFISLCLHHYKDLNSIYLLATRGISLSIFCDIFYYMVMIKPNPQELYSVSKRYKVDEYVYYCIYYTNRIFCDPRLEEYLKVFKSSFNQEIISCFGLTDDERREWRLLFEERVFTNDLKEYFKHILTYEDMLKIDINRKYM